MLDGSGLLTFLPRPVAVSLACIMVGVVGFAGHEQRYMTVADFTQSYILDLKREIRELRDDLANSDSPDVQRLMREQLEILLDQLCLEVPNDPYCRDR